MDKKHVIRWINIKGKNNTACMPIQFRGMGKQQQRENIMPNKMTKTIYGMHDKRMTYNSIKEILEWKILTIKVSMRVQEKITQEN